MSPCAAPSLIVANPTFDLSLMNLCYTIPALCFFESFTYSTHALATHVCLAHVHLPYIFNANNGQRLSDAYTKVY